MNAHDLFHSGNLSEAIKAALDDVRLHPADPSRRFLLCELLCFAGDLERADRHLDLIRQGQDEPQMVLLVHIFQQLIRGEQARQQFFAEGRLPEFYATPNAAVRLLLEASILVREGAPAEAAGRLARAEEERPRVVGKCNGQPFQDLRDLDDRTSCILEVIAGDGRYYWLPIDEVESIEFRAPERPRDLLWRRSRLVIRNGLNGEVFLPALYAGTHAEDDDRTRLGRATDWRGDESSPTRGVGQRMFLVGDEARPIMEFATLQVDAPAPG